MTNRKNVHRFNRTSQPGCGAGKQSGAVAALENDMIPLEVKGTSTPGAEEEPQIQPITKAIGKVDSGKERESSRGGKKKLSVLLPNIRNKDRSSKDQSSKDSRQAKVTRTLLVLYICYVAVFIPYTLVVTFQVPRVISTIFAGVLLLNNCINPPLYAITNNEFKNAYIHLFTCNYSRVTNLRTSVTITRNKSGK